MADPLQQAVDCIRSSGCLIYPTETFYALGASALDESAATRVAGLKHRGIAKPLPVVIGDMEQLAAVTAWKDDSFFRLTDAFWPGPLSILVPAQPEIVSLARDHEGWTSLRLSSHPLARRLCLESDRPLLATSANLSGRAPASDPEDLDPDLLERADCLVTGPPYPAGGRPSTVVRLCGPAAVSVIRHGAIDPSELEKAGFQVVRDRFLS